jgi:hypothetical protein
MLHLVACPIMQLEEPEGRSLPRAPATVLRLQDSTIQGTKVMEPKRKLNVIVLSEPLSITDPAFGSGIECT